MEDFRTDNDFQIVDMEMLSIHVNRLTRTHHGIPNLDDFDTEMDRMIWMVQMLYKHPSLQRDSRWRLAFDVLVSHYRDMDIRTQR